MSIQAAMNQRSAKLSVAVDDLWECVEQLETVFTALSRARDQLTYLNLVDTMSPEKKDEVETVSTQIDVIEQGILLIKETLATQPLHRYQAQGESLKFETIC